MRIGFQRRPEQGERRKILSDLEAEGNAVKYQSEVIEEYIWNVGLKECSRDRCD